MMYFAVTSFIDENFICTKTYVHNLLPCDNAQLLLFALNKVH